MLYFFRPVKDICGFSRETVIAVTTNIESMESRRRQNGEIGYEEHPRAGTTDDVEAIIAFLHRMLGVVFTLKQFKAGWKQVVRLVCTLHYFVALPYCQFPASVNGCHHCCTKYSGMERHNFLSYSHMGRRT